MTLLLLFIASLLGTSYLILVDRIWGKVIGEDACRIELLKKSMLGSISPKWSIILAWSMHVLKGYLVTLVIYAILDKFENSYILMNGTVLGFVAGSMSTVFWSYFITSPNSTKDRFPSSFLVQLVISYAGFGFLISVLLLLIFGYGHFT
ncbi:hypothetical protein [Cytophaga sp. FL35]|uniref:hypothetical protein n=1 Tax=Cytophaga sp. FL35 TaxID=1904456 RepID=UPI001653B340|nr:hypothetical protein [Cytophaga sp. FL35]MBC7000881.1 hypothetical protein [Cytophaga sp. FL35]